jgi:hypothetical protein
VAADRHFRPSFGSRGERGNRFSRLAVMRARRKRRPQWRHRLWNRAASAEWIVSSMMRWCWAGCGFGRQRSGSCGQNPLHRYFAAVSRRDRRGSVWISGGAASNAFAVSSRPNRFSTVELNATSFGHRAVRNGNQCIQPARPRHVHRTRPERATVQPHPERRVLRPS